MMTEFIHELYAIPFIKRLLHFPLIERYKIFLGTYTLSFVNKWTKRLQKFMSLKTLLFINIAVLAYYAGKANAVCFSDWYQVFLAYHLWFKSAILINASYFIARLLRLIFIITLIAIAFFFIIWIVCDIIFWVSDHISGNSDNEIVVNKSDNPK